MFCKKPVNVIKAPIIIMKRFEQIMESGTIIATENDTYRISSIIIHLPQIFGVGPAGLPRESVLCENYVKDALQGLPKSSRNNNKYKCISTNTYTYQELPIHISIHQF